MPTAERHLALRILRAAARGRKTLGDLLAEPSAEKLDPKGRALLQQLVLGTLRHRGGLDHAIRKAADRGLETLDEAVLAALRLGAYQVLKLRIPDHAAVSETVDLAKAEAPRAAGFVNAVLRRLAREGAEPPPDPDRDPLGWLLTEGSLPPWLAERWLAREGATIVLARARAFLESPPVTFRMNPRRPEARARVDEAGLAPIPLSLPDCWQATAGRAVPLAQEGLVWVQDLGSQVVAHLADSGARVLDACAAPGGKAALLADLDPARRVVALEISARRLDVMRLLFERWNATTVDVLRGDAQRPPFAEAAFDSVLLDAPCSGLGTIGRNPDLKWKIAAADIERHAERQRSLILAAAGLVRPKGRLVYSACTLEPEETTAVVDALLHNRRDFRRIDLPDWAAPFRETDGLRVRPERHPGDGFFAAILERE